MKPKIVFSDFDGTLTLHEQLRVSFFEILELLNSHKIPLVIVTGRSKSWAHFLLTHFHSMTAAISEGGGNLTIVEGREGKSGLRILRDELLVEQLEVEKLRAVTRVLIEKFKVELSADSFGRESDRAIELYDLDDPKKLAEIQKFLAERKIPFSTSNVHLNFWSGEISKINAIHTYLDRYTDLTIEDAIFFGDSLNDQTVFKEMNHTVGVSNISSVLDRMEHRPKIILEGKENEGPAGVLSYLQKLLQ